MDSDYAAGVWEKINGEIPITAFHNQPNFDLWLEMLQAKNFFGQDKHRNIVLKVVKSHTGVQTIQDKWEKFYHLGNQVVDNAA